MLSAVVRRPTVEVDASPILVLLHGYGSNEEDLMGLAPELDGRFTVVCPRAPLRAPNGGFAWFDLNWDADGLHPNMEQAVESRLVAASMLAELPESLGLINSPLILGGFSQGAMMSVGIGLLKPELLTGVISMSGRMIPAFEAEIELETKPPVLIQHGKYDTVVPVEGSRQCADYLRNAGFEVSFFEYPMAHEIGLESLTDARHWIAERLLTLGY